MGIDHGDVRVVGSPVNCPDSWVQLKACEHSPSSLESQEATRILQRVVAGVRGPSAETKARVGRG